MMSAPAVIGRRSEARPSGSLKPDAREAEEPLLVRDRVAAANHAHDRSEERGDGEEMPGDDGRQAGAAALGDAGGRLDVGRDRASAEQTADGGRGRVDGKMLRMPGTLPSASAKPACSPTEMTVPIVSKKSVSMIAKTAKSKRRREDLDDRDAALDLLERCEEGGEVGWREHRVRQLGDAEEQRRDRSARGCPRGCRL